MDEADAKQAHAALSDAGDRPRIGKDSVEKTRPSRLRRRATWVALLAALLAAALVLPGLIDIGHYKGKIAGLMSRSMGRPVRMSGVELRLLPTPGFVLRDLQVAEDPGFGAEPILSARTVVASIRLPALLLGRLEISRVSVDEASLNLVRSAEGRWNLETLMMGAQPGLSRGNGPPARHIPGTAAHFPYLEATESRVNLKNGVEKSPFSLVDADLSLWQDAPGQWRVRLRGQPVRTDIPMSLADTGEVRLEASLQSAPQLRDMPLKLDMEWRNAQLGQLSRLITGSDAGWRGDLTADIAVLGTPESAETKARLRATGVRREEFAPETPLDFDANCSFRYQHSLNAAHEVNCNTAIGDGRLHLKAELPGRAGLDGKAIPAEAMLEVKDVPLQAGLDLLRTLRSGFAPGISAKGAVNGSLTYKEVAQKTEANGAGKTPRRRVGRKLASVTTAADGGDLQGSLTVEGAEFTGGQLREPLEFPRIAFTPTAVADAAVGSVARDSAAAMKTMLSADFAVGLGTPAQTGEVQVYLGSSEYRAVLGGSAEMGRLRELAYAFGWPHLDALDSFTGGSVDFSLKAQGPWIAAEDAAGLLRSTAPIPPGTIFGSLTVRHTEWSAAYLARPVVVTQGAATVANGSVDFTGEFSYGNPKDAAKGLVRGSIALHAPSECAATVAAGGQCLPQVQVRFGALDGATLEAALLGAPEEPSLLSELMDRMRASDRAKWPAIALSVQAESLALGPATLEKPVAEIRFEEGAAVVKHWEAGLLGGTAEGTGRIGWADDKPQYAFDGSFADLKAAALGAMLGGGWTGGPVSGSGEVRLSGRRMADLAASATGTVLFDWQRGAGLTVGNTAAPQFDDWSGTAAIAGGTVELGENLLRLKRKALVLAGTISFSGPVKLAVAPAVAKQAETKQAVK